VSNIRSRPITSSNLLLLGMISWNAKIFQPLASLLNLHESSSFESFERDYCFVYNSFDLSIGTG
jgi:hypothetical protein